MIKYMSRLNAELAAKVKEAYLRPAEIKVTGKFTKTKKRRWKRIIRKNM